MRKKILLRTAYKVGKFFGFLVFLIGYMFLAEWVGNYFFQNAFVGYAILLVTAMLWVIVSISYKEAKYEVDRENDKLIRELTKNG